MPRDGLQQYAPPAGTQGIPNYTVESARYNTFVADVSSDQNNPRPIVAGGTAANNAHDALINLHGEESGQLVDNYDTFPFVGGSFKSAPGATAAPNPTNYFVGSVTDYNGNSMVIVAHDGTTGIAYKRIKSFADGTWDTWKQQAGSTAVLDAAYVNATGDTMTGPLSIGGAATIYGSGLPSLLFNQTSATATKQRMGLLYDGSTVLSNPGIVVQALDDAGGFAGNSGVLWRDGGLSLGGSLTRPNGGAGGLRVESAAASTSPATGALTVAGGLGVGGAVNVGTTLSVGTPLGGLLPGDLSVARGGNAGVVFFGTGSAYLFYSGSGFTMPGGPLTLGGEAAGATQATTKGYVDTRPGAIRAAALIDVFGGRGFSLGVATVTDAGVGYTDVSYNFTYSAGVQNCVVAGINVTAANQCVNVGTPGAANIRIHCIITTTTVLTDPQYYTFHATGA